MPQIFLIVLMACSCSSFSPFDLVSLICLSATIRQLKWHHTLQTVAPLSSLSEYLLCFFDPELLFYLSLPSLGYQRIFRLLHWTQAGKTAVLPEAVHCSSELIPRRGEIACTTLLSNSVKKVKEIQLCIRQGHATHLTHQDH